jgi:hypothetical protein
LLAPCLIRHILIFMLNFTEGQSWQTSTPTKFLRVCSIIFNPYGLKMVDIDWRDFDLIGIETPSILSIYMD